MADVCAVRSWPSWFELGPAPGGAAAHLAGLSCLFTKPLNIMAMIRLHTYAQRAYYAYAGIGWGW